MRRENSAVVRPAAGRTALSRRLVAACLLAAGPARALDFPGPVGWSGAVAAASDSVHRGITWSDGRPVLSADVAASTDQGWSGAVGVESPSYPDRGGRAGLTWAVAKSWQLDADLSRQASLTRYAFTGRAMARAFDYTEFGLAWAWQGRLFLNAAVSPDRPGLDPGSGRLRRAWAAALEIGLSQRIGGRWALDAGIGDAPYFIPGRQRGYRYGSVGLRWGVGPVQIHFAAIASDAARRGFVSPDAAGRRLLVQVGWVY